ncbi:MAG: flagellar protein [Lachnospiraceae bacterium]|nr:flagellar protein [Lachnospiraceae bacterium]
MNVKNCRKCGKIYNYIGGLPICPTCREAADKQFNEVKEFVRENKGASIKQVSEKCGVDEAQIRQWVREERLVFDTDSGIGVVCETCGTPIASGRYCDRCKLELANGLAAAGRRPAQSRPQAPVRESPRMRFLDNK